MSVETLEPRILLASVNPGDPAILTDGDQLFFLQGQDTTNPGPDGGEINQSWIVIATFVGPGQVELYNTYGANVLNNGDKIGDIEFTGTTADSNFYIEMGRLQQGATFGSLLDPLIDRPNTLATALTIVVPTGEVGATATFNSGIAIVPGLGSVSGDWYMFTAQEAEMITVTSTDPGATITMYTQYGTNPTINTGGSPYTISDSLIYGTPGTLDNVNVYVQVDFTPGTPYTLVIQRTELDDVPLLNQTSTEDFPELAAGAINIAYDATTQTGLSPLAEPFTLTGQGVGTSGHDFFTFTVRPGETLYGTGLTNITQIILTDGTGNPLGLLSAGTPYTNGTAGEVTVVMDVESTGNWSVDLEMSPPLLSNLVEVNTTQDTWPRYSWPGSSSQAWVLENYLTFPSTPIYAPTSIGAAVVDNVSFDSTSTGFGTFLLDGTLMGTLGTGLAHEETIHEVHVGYINSGAGIDTNGNVDRVLVTTSVGVPQGSAADVPQGTQLYGPAAFTIDGYLGEFQAGGTIYADFDVNGNSTATPVFDFDLRADDLGEWPAIGYAELFSDSASAGFLNDTPETAFIVGSPTGDFYIDGTLYYDPVFFPLLPPDKWDSQDWYVFNAGLGEQVTVTLDVLSSDDGGYPVWIFAPSGWLVDRVGDGESVTFCADEGGNYMLMVGELFDSSRVVEHYDYTTYEITVEGAAPLAVGGIIAASDLFGGGAEGSTFGDDMSNTAFVADSVGFIQVKHDGLFGDNHLTVSGDVGYLDAGSMTSDDFDFMVLDIGGNLDRLETGIGDVSFNSITIGGDLGELQTFGNLGFEFNTPKIIDIGGTAGSLVVGGGGNFFGQLRLWGEGIDLFWVDGDFGSSTIRSSISTDTGGDVRFAHVGGTIYHLGLPVAEVEVMLGQEVLFTDDGGAQISLTPTAGSNLVFGLPLTPWLTYRYLPVGRLGGGTLGAVLSEVNVVDSLEVYIPYGRADLPVISFINMTSSNRSVTLSGGDPYAELDVYAIYSAAPLNTISNTTFRGDILNILTMGSVENIFAAGHLGLTDKYLTECSSLLNTGENFPMYLNTYINYDPSLLFASGGTLDHDYSRYYNGINVLGDVKNIAANGSIGDFFAGSVGTMVANADGVDNGTAFSLRGHYVAAGTWDGLAGVAWTMGFDFLGQPAGFKYIDPGDGIYGGTGGIPVGGIFSGSIIGTVDTSWATISGPIWAQGYSDFNIKNGMYDKYSGIQKINAFNTVFDGAFIGVGADLSDWVSWDEFLSTPQGPLLSDFRLSGSLSVIDDTRIRAGQIGKITVDKGAQGIWNSDIFAGGVSSTGLGIDTISIMGGGIGDTTIFSMRDINKVDLKGAGVDMTDTSIQTLTRIGTISLKGGDIIVVDGASITALLGIKSIAADNILDLGPGTLDIATSLLPKLTVLNNVSADITVDGPISSISMKGALSGNLDITGPQGYLASLKVGNGISGDVTVGSYIGAIDVKTGGISGNITAGGSTSSNLAIGSIKLGGGNLSGNVATEVNPASFRPGGGIGKLDVKGGAITGDITATSYHSLSHGFSVTANIGSIKASGGGDLNGNVTIQRNDALDPLDPGGNLVAFALSGGDLNGNVSVEGDIGKLDVKGGGINGNISALGSDVGSISVSSLGGTALAGNLYIEGSLGSLSVKVGNVQSSITVLGDAGKLAFGGNLTDSTILVGDYLASLSVGGNMHASNLDAHAIGKVGIKGTLTGDGAPPYRIHASSGSFDLSVGPASYMIDFFNDAFFDSNKVHAYVL